ncbi:MAG: signal peptidase I [Oscillospiraceae bacterium]
MIFKKICFWLSVVLLSLLILAFSVPKFFGIQMKNVKTPSMEPEIPVGSLVVVYPEQFEKISRGDDITFVLDESLNVVTHRVEEVDTVNRIFITKGITNNVSESVKYENVLGKVAFSVPFLGQIISWFDSLPNKIIAISIIIILVAFSLLLSSGKNKKEKNKINKRKEEI